MSLKHNPLIVIKLLSICVLILEKSPGLLLFAENLCRICCISFQYQVNLQTNWSLMTKIQIYLGSLHCYKVCKLFTQCDWFEHWWPTSNPEKKPPKTCSIISSITLLTSKANFDNFNLFSTHPSSKMKLPIPVESQNCIKVARRAVKEVFTILEGVGVTNLNQPYKNHTHK